MNLERDCFCPGAYVRVYVFIRTHVYVFFVHARARMCVCARACEHARLCMFACTRAPCPAGSKSNPSRVVLVPSVHVSFFRQTAKLSSFQPLQGILSYAV